MISIQFLYDIYTGGAHPNQVIETRNFGRTPFQELSLDQFPTYKNQREFLSEISKFCREEVVRQKRARFQDNAEHTAEQIWEPDQWEDDWIRRGAGPDWKNFENFYIEGDAIRFEFPPYQVAGYAEGFFACSMPFAQLEHLMRPEIVEILRGGERIDSKG